MVENTDPANSSGTNAEGGQENGICKPTGDCGTVTVATAASSRGAVFALERKATQPLRSPPKFPFKPTQYSMWEPKGAALIP